MKKVLTIRFAVAAFAVAAVVLGSLALLPEPQAIASPGVCTYYSSAKYRTVVGQRGTGCCGETISWGSTSAYKKCEPLYCLDVLCPGSEI